MLDCNAAPGRNQPEAACHQRSRGFTVGDHFEMSGRLTGETFFPDVSVRRGQICAISDFVATTPARFDVGEEDESSCGQTVEQEEIIFQTLQQELGANRRAIVDQVDFTIEDTLQNVVIIKLYGNASKTGLEDHVVNLCQKNAFSPSSGEARKDKLRA